MVEYTEKPSVVAIMIEALAVCLVTGIVLFSILAATDDMPGVTRDDVHQPIDW